MRLKLIVMMLLIGVSTSYGQYGDTFKVLLDPGHGGSDPGTNHHGYYEKTIVLNVALKVGKLLEKYPDIQVVYTRKTDVAIGLKERANFANKSKANLFISIHCNGVKNTEPFGVETYVMGTARNATNLEVAKKENSVIMLEKDYQVHYEGFDPNKPESLIGLKLAQEENIEQSINFASKVQSNFVERLKRKDRNVKQAPLWVLDATVMPGVLLELGFLSNKAEGYFLNSNNGQDLMAKAIADAIISYKNEVYGGATPLTPQTKDLNEINTPDNSIVNTVIDDSKPVFKIQISASKNKLDLKPSNFKGLNNVTLIHENGMYRYYYGETNDYEVAKNLQKEARSAGFDSAFMVAFKNGNKLANIQEALK